MEADGEHRSINWLHRPLTIGQPANRGLPLLGCIVVGSSKQHTSDHIYYSSPVLLDTGDWGKRGHICAVKLSPQADHLTLLLLSQINS